MALQIEKYVNIRPFLYHLTASENLAYIQGCRSISPAATLIKHSGRTDLLHRQRQDHELIRIGGQEIVLRDQRPLYQGNLELPQGYRFEDFVHSLNSRVFFWPGTAAGPKDYGIRHFERYRHERPVVLRVRCQSLIAANPSAKPLLCRYNSGAPRCYMGKKSPRGPDTFLEVSHFVGSPSDVVEVTFDQEIVMPFDAVYGYSPAGPWQPII